MVDFPDNLRRLTRSAIKIAALTIKKQTIYAKWPLHLKKSVNLVHLENGTYEQFISVLKNERELNSVEAPD